jgi:hypothetical protein
VNLLTTTVRPIMASGTTAARDAEHSTKNRNAFLE